MTSRLPIFRSPEQERLLTRLFVLASEPLSITDLARSSDTSVAGAHKEVERLEAAKLVTSKRVGRSRLVEANRESPVFQELRGLLTKLAGPQPLLRDALSGIDRIQRAFIFGSWADPTESAPADIDLLVIGDPDVSSVYDAVTAVEAEVGRPINVAIRSDQEWAEAGGGFERSVRDRPILEVL